MGIDDLTTPLHPRWKKYPHENINADLMSVVWHEKMEPKEVHKMFSDLIAKTFSKQEQEDVKSLLNTFLQYVVKRYEEAPSEPLSVIKFFATDLTYSRQMSEDIWVTFPSPTTLIPFLDMIEPIKGKDFSENSTYSNKLYDFFLNFFLKYSSLRNNAAIEYERVNSPYFSPGPQSYLPPNDTRPRRGKHPPFWDLYG